MLIRNLVIAASVAVAVALVTLSGAAQKPIAQNFSAHAPAATQCADANLKLRFIDTDAAMGGQRSAMFAFKNIGTAVCTLTGFPKLVLLNRSGKVMAAKKVHRSDDTPAAVELAPGKEANFNVDYNNGGAGYTGPPCPASTRIRVTVPGGIRIFTLTNSIALCDDVTVSPVQAPEPPAQ